MSIKKFTVSLVRVEHRIYQIEVEAKDRAEAEEMAEAIWLEDDEAFTDMGCVHAEEDIHEVKETEAA